MADLPFAMSVGAHYEQIRSLTAVYDQEALSDEAHRWAADELDLLPGVKAVPAGVVRSMLAGAFEAGRMLGERSPRGAR